MRLKSKSLGNLDFELLSPGDLNSPAERKIINYSNSWTELDDKKEKLKQIKKNVNLKKMFLDLFTSDFDKKLESNKKNMRSASIRLLTYLRQNNGKIPNYMNNAVTNIVILILTNGEKFLSAQQVKINVHFYLKLAEKAFLEGDHQTAILIKCVMENHNIKRLNLKLSKIDKEILKTLDYKYGVYNKCYSYHLDDFLEKIKNFENLNSNYIPSTMVIDMYSGRTKNPEKFRRLGKFPKKNINIEKFLPAINRYYHNNFSDKKDMALTKVYRTNPEDILFVKKLNPQNSKSLKDILFEMSFNVKNLSKNCKDLEHLEKVSYNRLIYCK